MEAFVEVTKHIDGTRSYRWLGNRFASVRVSREYVDEVKGFLPVPLTCVDIDLWADMYVYRRTDVVPAFVWRALYAVRNAALYLWRHGMHAANRLGVARTEHGYRYSWRDCFWWTEAIDSAYEAGRKRTARILKSVTFGLVMMLAASFCGALEFQAWTPHPPTGCGSQWGSWVIVNPSYTGSDVCVVASVPGDAVNMRWIATELWEKPPQVSDEEKRRLAGSVLTYDGWTKLTCGAAKQGPGWSFSCFNAGEIGSYSGVTLDGYYSGSAAQLDALVKAWWAGQR